MNNRNLLLFLLLLIGNGLYAQDITKGFELKLPKDKVYKSHYNQISYLDSRNEKNQIGIIQIGILRNTDASLVLKVPFGVQLTKIMDTITDITARQGEVLFQLNRFNFIEKYGTRYCYFRAHLYAKSGDGYRVISTINTVTPVTINDVFGYLTNVISDKVGKLISESLLKDPVDSLVLTKQEVEQIDSIEKSKIPLYTTEIFKDGVYTNYTSFFNQTPDKQAEVKLNRDNNISVIRITDANGNKTKLKSKDVYAIAAKGFLFIATQYGFYKLDKLGEDFIFTGEVKTLPSNADMRGAQFALGLTGMLLEHSGNRSAYTMMLDHTNGEFIHLRAIADYMQP